MPEKFRSSIEHIIVDGNSTDGSIELIKQYPHIDLIVENDSGLYEAINKGIKRATGKYICFLSTDDFISDDFFENFFEKTDDWQSTQSLLTLNFNKHTGNTKTQEMATSFTSENILLGKTPLFSMLISRDIFDRLHFNEDFKIAGDFDLSMKMLRTGIYSKTLSYGMYNFWLHNCSLTGHQSEDRDLEYSEVIQIIYENLLYFISDRKALKIVKNRVREIDVYTSIHGRVIKISTKLQAKVIRILALIL